MPETKILSDKCLKRIHVNQNNLRQRVNGSSDAPCYTVKYKGRTYWAYEIQILGPCRMVESIDNPLGCGARLWLETYSPVALFQK